MEYFVVTNSFAAPFFSDMDERFVEAKTPAEAMKRVVEEYGHPAGLYAAVLYADANAYHKNGKPLLRWVSNHEIAKLEATEGQGSYSYYGEGPGRFEIDGKKVAVKDPKGGRIVSDKEAKRWGII